MKQVDSIYLEKNPRFLSIRKDTVDLEKGIRIDGYIVAESSNWVNAVVLSKDNHLILVKQFRYAVKETVLEIPAGSIEECETPEEAVIREVREETGYTSKEPPLFLGEHYVNPAHFTNAIRSYLILEAENTEKQDLDEAEEIEVVRIPFEEVDEWIESGKLKQLFSINAILLAQKKINQLKGAKEHD